MMRSRPWILFAAVILMAVGLAPVAAQTRLSDGASLLGNLGPNAPAVSFTFDAAPGDRIGVRVLGLNELNPILTVVGPDGAELASARTDPSTLEPGDSLITLAAPTAGAYTVNLSAEPDSAGDFLLQFAQSAADSIFPLPAGESVPIQVSAAGGTLLLRFENRAECPTVLVALPSGEAGFRALLAITGEQGTLQGQVTLGQDEQRLTVGAGTSSTLIELTPLPGSSDGEVTFTTTCAAEQPACTEAPASDSAVPVAFTSVDAAQTQSGGGTFYGLARQGAIAQDGAPVRYTFDGAAGDAVALLVTGLSAGFDPELVLAGPDQTTVGVASNAPGSLRPTDAVLRVVLPADGQYAAIVGSATGKPGDFVIRLAQETPQESIPLAADSATEVDLSALPNSDGLQRYTFEALETCPTALTIDSTGSLVAPVTLRTAGGETVGQITPSLVSGASLVVPARNGAYEVLIPPAADGTAGTLRLQVSCQMESPACTAIEPLPVSTPTSAAPDVTLRGVVSQNANLRTGDSPNYRVIQSLKQGTELEVTGISDTGSGWFKVRLADGTEGWIIPFAVTLEGDPRTLPPLTPGST